MTIEEVLALADNNQRIEYLKKGRRWYSGPKKPLLSVRNSFCRKHCR